MTRTTKRAMAAALAVTLSGVPAPMADPSTDAIKNRQQAMKDIGGAMQKLAAIAKKETPFDAGVVKSHAGIIAEALEKASTLFPGGTDEGGVETWAQPEVWSQLTDFGKKFEASQAEAVALQSVSVESALLPALGKLGDTCKACHQTYRRPKE